MADYRTTCPVVEREGTDLVRRELEVILAHRTPARRWVLGS